MGAARLSRFDRAMLGTAYVLLVVITAWNAFWIKDRLDQAQEERCLAVVTNLEVSLLVWNRITSDPLTADEQALVDRVREQVRELCPTSPV